MYSITVNQILDLGIARSTVNQNINKRKWKTLGKKVGRYVDGDCQVLLSSLPSDIQMKWLQHSSQTDPDQRTSGIKATGNLPVSSADEELGRVLARYPHKERLSWCEEACRLFDLISRYDVIRPKRELDPELATYVYVSAVLQLCDEAVCTSPIILKREPHRGNPPSPHTLRLWSQKCREEGVFAFFRALPQSALDIYDRRRAVISMDAVHWINDNWKRFRGARALYSEVKKISESKGWVIPSESWFYRVWNQIPKIVESYLFKGEAAYVSKFAPYVPRDLSDVEALQVVCGDHSERDVVVMLKDKTLIRPWLTPWQDLRTGLIWGSHLGKAPSAQAAALAYADGVQTYGAQPIPRPEQGFYSYIYTDHGRTYKSHRWDGKEIAVHESAMSLNGAMNLLLKQREVGILKDLQIRRLMARRFNAKEKPIERFFKDVSAWEQYTFDSYCGSNPSQRPDRLRILYEHHNQYLQGKRKVSPFPTLEQYHAALTDFIARYNHSEHERSNLGGERIVPIQEFRRLYTTRYEISRKTLALLLLIHDRRVIEKDGVNCFRRNWFYYHESMSGLKGSSVEILYSDDDYKTVWVILPNGDLCEASLITPTSLLNPNKATLQTVKEACAHERSLIRNYQLLQESQMRGETTEDRVMKQSSQEQTKDPIAVQPEPEKNSGIVHQLTRFDHVKNRSTASTEEIAATDFSEGESDDSIFASSEPIRIKEFEHEKS